MPANDVWIVTMPDGRTLPLPVIDDVVLSVDVAARVIVAYILPGLLDLSTNSAEERDE